MAKDSLPMLSIVVPVYNGADTIAELVAALSALEIPGGIEIVLVHDCGQDDSWTIMKRLAEKSIIPMTLINHSRNYGEHNSVMDGLRHVMGKYIVTLDDDLQNPPDEILKLYNHLRSNDLDVVYGVYAKKQHAWWRNLGSKFANHVADWISDKPRGLYLSTFRCMNRFLVDNLVQYQGPFVYIDGLIFQITLKADSVIVEHLPNRTDRTNYTFRRLVHLWLTILMNFSVKPLRLSIILGLCMFLIGMVGAIDIVVQTLLMGPRVSGWASLATMLLVFTGTQFLVLGLLGEYVGRTFLTLNKKPQSTVREIIISKRHGSDIE
jgi:glycosyltransferase involved in cell wall biosynthesis